MFRFINLLVNASLLIGLLKSFTMFDELNKYKQNDHFFFTPTQNVKEACNAPVDRSGVYLVYTLAPAILTD